MLIPVGEVEGPKIGQSSHHSGSIRPSCANGVVHDDGMLDMLALLIHSAAEVDLPIRAELGAILETKPSSLHPIISVRNLGLGQNTLKSDLQG